MKMTIFRDNSYLFKAVASHTEGIYDICYRIFPIDGQVQQLKRRRRIPGLLGLPHAKISMINT